MTPARPRAARLAEIGNFNAPTRIVFGADDPYLNPALARALHVLFPNSRPNLIARAGHYVQLDQPEEVAATILAD